MKRIIVFLLIFFNFLYAYQSEKDLKVLITGKVAKFVTWKEDIGDKFVITVYKNSFEKLFEKKLLAKKIKGKSVEIRYIEDISQLQETHILYIAKATTDELTDIFSKIKGKNVLTVSCMRGFAQKGGAVQIYFVSQKGKLAINLDTIQSENFKVKSSFIRVAKLVSGSPM